MRGRPFIKQPTPQELLDSALSFIQTHFYQGQPVVFAKDRPRLLKWVVLRLATWLNERGVTLPADRYRKILLDTILMEALRHGNTSHIYYVPAWLGKVVESHLAVHGEEYYAEGKSIRNLVEHALVIAGQAARPAAADPVRSLADAARLVNPKKRRPKLPVKTQLTLL